MNEIKNIALIAHDKKKEDIIKLVLDHMDVFKDKKLFATDTTGKLISKLTGLKVHRFLSGPLGGDQQIGARIADGAIDLVIFMRDPLTAQPHEPDVSALLRLCDVHCIPLATNHVSASIILESIKARQ